MRLYLSIWGIVFTGFGWWLLELGSPLVFGHNFGMSFEVNSGSPFSLEIDVLSTFWNFLGTCWAAIWYLSLIWEYLMVNCIWTIWKAFWEPIFIRNQPFEHLLERPVYLLGSHLVFGLDFGISDGHLKSILGAHFH